MSNPCPNLIPEPERSGDHGIAAVEAAASALFEDVDLRLFRLPACRERHLCAVCFRVSSQSERRTLARLVRFFADRGHLIYPARLPRDQWQRVGEISEQLEPVAQQGLLARLRDARDAGRPERDVKRWLMHTIKRDIDALESLDTSRRLPEHLRLLAAADVVRESLELLMALRDRAWVEDAGLVATFGSVCEASAHLPDDALTTYLELRAATLLAYDRHRSLGRRRSPDPDLGPCRHLLAAVEREVVGHFETKQEGRRRRRLSSAIRHAPLAAAALFVAGYTLHTWPESPVETLPQQARCGGIQGRYFQGKTLEKELLTRFDRRIYFDTSGKVDKRVPADHFSARWNGFLSFAEDGRYSICVESDDGSRLRFNGRTLIEDWQVHPVTRSCATVYVRAGWYPIDVEYFEEGRAAVMKLLRGPDAEHVTPVPSSDLCSSG